HKQGSADSQDPSVGQPGSTSHFSDPLACDQVTFLGDESDRTYSFDCVTNDIVGADRKRRIRNFWRAAIEHQGGRAAEPGERIDLPSAVEYARLQDCFARKRHPHPSKYVVAGERVLDRRNSRVLYPERNGSHGKIGIRGTHSSYAGSLYPPERGHKRRNRRT